MSKLTFKVGDSEYYVRRPNQKDINDGDLVYKTKYSEALRYGALSAAEAEKIIKERSLWTQDDDKEVHELFIKLRKLGDDLMKTDKFTDAAHLIYEMERVRTDILRINLRKNNILDNTAEAYADDHRLQFYVVVCTFDADDNKVFKDIHDYVARASEEIAQIAMTKLIHLIANKGKDFREEWPEFQWRIKHGLVDSNLNPVKEKMDEFIQKAAEEVEDEKPAKKTRTRRKTTTK